MKIEASAPGKLVLLGEYAVLYGAPALAVATKQRARVTLTPSPSPRVTSGGGREQPLEEASAVVIATWRRAQQYVAQRGAVLPALHARIETSEFIAADGQKLGLGASAAVATALYAGLLRAVQLVPSEGELLQEMVAAHRASQGERGSGIDVAASLLGGLVQFQLDSAGVAQAHRATVPAGVRVIAVWTGREAPTRPLLERLEAARLRAPGAFAQALEPLAAAAQAALAMTDAADWARAAGAYGTALDAFGKALELDVVSAAHQELGRIVGAAGGSYKPSGAGGGDFGLAIASSTDEVRRLQAALQHRQTFVLTQAEPGLAVTLE